MRPKFRESLEHYGEIAKDMKKASGSKMGELATVLDWRMGKEAEAAKGTLESQFSVFSVQQKKQDVMARLTEEIRALDDAEVRAEKPRGAVEVFGEGEGFVLANRRSVTLGEILTDGDWGVSYHLDPETVPRNVRKEYLIEQAKRKLQSYLDDQIIAAETGSGKIDDGKKRAYKALKAERRHGKETGGHAMEKMVKNFFRKLAIDNALPINVDHADVFQDVEQKIDFIFRRPKRLRGVGIEERDDVSDVAVQFTNDTRPETLHRKQRQLRSARERLDEEDAVADIILIAMPTDGEFTTVRAWEQAGKPPGGPDGMWSADVQERVFRTLLNGFMSEEELNEHWDSIRAQIDQRA